MNLLNKISRLGKKIQNIVNNSSAEEVPTVAQGWDEYAHIYINSPEKRKTHLGEEWNESEEIGIDVPANQIVSYLDQTVFSPFLGNCDVMLEIGPGGGRFTEILLPKCNQLIAADTSPRMIEILKNRFQDSSKIDYLLLDGKSLFPLADNSVDAAFSYGVFVHIQHWDIYNYLVELNRVIKPGGKAIIQHANTFSELGWRKFLKQLPPQLSQHKLPNTFTVMTPAIMQEFTQRAGLKLESCIINVAKRDCISLITSPG
jgi:SAM-dependent methyltransferase